MTIMITMAGHGSRFAEAGYILPKYRILARGRSLFEWSIESLRAFFDQPFIFACLSTDDAGWIECTAKRMGVLDVRVVSRSSVSLGQAETAYDGLVGVNSTGPLWIYNIDTHVAPLAMTPGSIDGADGCIYVFPSCATNMSYIGYDSEGFVNRVAEKQVISSWATVGMYGFASASQFRSLYREAYADCDLKLVGGERYVAPMYDIVVRQGGRIVAPRLPSSAVQILGTPQQVLIFDPNLQKPAGG